MSAYCADVDKCTTKFTRDSNNGWSRLVSYGNTVNSKL